MVVCILFLSDGETSCSGHFSRVVVWPKTRKLSFRRLYVISYSPPPFSGVQDFIPCCNLDMVSETFAEDSFLSVHISFVSGVSTRCSRLSQFPRIIR